jgi:hypothetical protein
MPKIVYGIWRDWLPLEGTFSFQEWIWTFERRSGSNSAGIQIVELIAEIHDGDPTLRADWPWGWWSLEPFDRRRRDWRMRYATAFRIVGPQPQ